MSSTSRGGKRTEADNYSTPPHAVRRFFETIRAGRTSLPLHGSWLEPAAGDGNIIRVGQEELPGVEWHAVELRPDPAPQLTSLISPDRLWCPQDYLTWESPEKYDVVITNPPFSLAEQFLHHGLQHSLFVILLLRLNFLESRRRFEFLSQNLPNEIWVLPQRPSFDSRGTDSIAYAWMVWNVRAPTSCSRLSLLPLTPKAELFCDRKLRPKKPGKPRKKLDVMVIEPCSSPDDDPDIEVSDLPDSCHPFVEAWKKLGDEDLDNL